MKRLTRTEQQQLTHERLLEAGQTILLERGFLATTVEEIASAAGYTRGAVYKHFGGKEGLWLAITEARADAHLRALSGALSRVTDHRGLIAVLTPSAAVENREAARWSLTAAEFITAVARQPERAALAVATQQRQDEALVSVIEETCRRLGLEPAMPLRDLVVVLGSLGGSLAIRHGVDPAIDVPGLVTGLLQAMFPPARSS